MVCTEHFETKTSKEQLTYEVSLIILGFDMGAFWRQFLIVNQRPESPRTPTWLRDRDAAQVDAESPPPGNEILIHNCFMGVFLYVLYIYFAFVIHSGSV